MSDALINRVASSGLITLKPEEWAPAEQPDSFDLKPFLFMNLILKEQDFREAMKTYDWSRHQGKVLCVYCSTDAIIPSWAYMLVGSLAASVASELYFGTPEKWISHRLLHHVDTMDMTPFTGQRVILKGCSDKLNIGPEVYLALTARLVPIVKSLMFGEPCSTVPVYKQPKGA